MNVQLDRHKQNFNQLSEQLNSAQLHLQEKTSALSSYEEKLAATEEELEVERSKNSVSCCTLFASDSQSSTGTHRSPSQVLDVFERAEGDAGGCWGGRGLLIILKEELLQTQVHVESMKDCFEQEGQESIISIQEVTSCSLASSRMMDCL